MNAHLALHSATAVPPVNVHVPVPLPERFIDRADRLTSAPIEYPAGMFGFTTTELFLVVPLLAVAVGFYIRWVLRR